MAAYKDLVGQKITKVTSNPGEPKTGQMWYNSTDGKLRGLGIVSAWASSSSMTNAKAYRFGGGTTEAAFAAGGSPNIASTEEYNGSGWSAGGDLGTARYEGGSAGTQTAGLVYGGYGTAVLANTEEYNGTSWSEQNDLNNKGYSQGGFGTQTAAVYSSRFDTTASPINITDTEEYNGTSWSEGNNPSTYRADVGTAGSQTAGMIFGGQSPGPVVHNNTEFYDGTNWTTGPTLNNARSQLGGSGIQTAAIAFGGRYTPPGSVLRAFTEQYDGTSWSETADLATARRQLSSTRAETGNSQAIAFGGSAPSSTAVTEEFTQSTNTITAAAWSAGANFPTASSQVSGAGPRDAAIGIGGYPEGSPPTGKSYEYNGVAWSAEATLNPNTGTAGVEATAGTQTACINSQNTPGGPPYQYISAGEYDGSSWSNANNRPTDAYANAAAGTQTAGLFFGGATSPTAQLNTTLSYDGTNWTAEESLSTARRGMGGSGVQTAALGTAGYTNPPATFLTNTEEYGGESWTAGGSLLVATRDGRASGTQTDSIYFGGGTPTKTTATFGYDGTSWSTKPSLATARQLHGSGATSPVGAAWGTGGYYPGSSPNRTNTTEHFTEETSAANIADFTTS